jgi:hypothetical protein
MTEEKKEDNWYATLVNTVIVLGIDSIKKKVEKKENINDKEQEPIS